MILRFLSVWIQRLSKGWIALFTLLIFLLFTATVLPGQASQAQAVARDTGSPDLSFYYTAADLYRMAEAYGKAGRDAYIRARFTFDLLWPLVYMVFLATAISWLYSRVFPQRSAWQRANLLPLFAALFDYLENVSTALVMGRFPNPTPVVAGMAGVFTLVKWVLVTASFALLSLGVAIVVGQRVTNKRG